MSKNQAEKRKCIIICLFTCACTRGVHLEVVSDITIDSFLLAFQRLASCKSLPSHMISDNASTYLAGVEEIWKLFASDVLKEALGRQHVTRHFILK